MTLSILMCKALSEKTEKEIEFIETEGKHLSLVWPQKTAWGGDGGH